MRDSLIHEQVFFDFVKNHDILQHLKYTEERRKGQQIIGLLVGGDPGEDDTVFVPYVRELLKEDDVTIIDPNYDEIYESFINLDHNLDSVQYMIDLVESKQTREEISELAVNLIVKKLVDSNIDSQKVYVRVKPHWITDWCDQVIEVQ